VAETAIIVPLVEAEPAVERWRREYTPSGAAGMPPHVTLLVPFTDSELLTVGRLHEVEAVLAPVEPFRLSLARTARFPGEQEVLYLEPEPAAPFRRMTEALVRRFPEHRPYEERFARVVPHLTVAKSDDADILDEIESAVAAALPIEALADEIWIMALERRMWRKRHAFTLSSLG
jgi:2'-5' RNA ligase